MDFLYTGVSRRGSISVAGVAQDVAPNNPVRRGLTFQNTSDTTMRLTETGEDASDTVGYKVAAGQAVNISTGSRVSVWCSVADKTYEATEF